MPHVLRFDEQFFMRNVLVHGDLSQLADFTQQQIDFPVFLLIQ